MSPERDQYQFTIEEIISNAKEIMLRDGYHIPVVIMEVDKKLKGAQIPDMPATHGERLEFMNFLGQAAAKSGRVDQLQQVFMVTEGWMSEPSEDVPARIRPSEDPQRKEVLIISAIQVSKHKRQMEIFEVIRDANEQVIGLEKFLPGEKKEDESVAVPLLDAFVHGFQIAFQTKFN